MRPKYHIVLPDFCNWSSLREEMSVKGGETASTELSYEWKSYVFPQNFR